MLLHIHEQDLRWPHVLRTTLLFLPTSHSSTVPHAYVIPFPSLFLADDFTSYATTTASTHPRTCLTSYLSCSGCITMLLVKCVLNPTPTRFPKVLPAILPAVSCLIHIPLSAASFSQHKAYYYLSYLEKIVLTPCLPLADPSKELSMSVPPISLLQFSLQPIPVRLHSPAATALVKVINEL